LYKGREAFANGTFPEDYPLFPDEQGLLIRLGKVGSNVGDIDGHKLVEFKQYTDC